MTQAMARSEQQETGLTLATIREMTGYDMAQIALIRHNMATTMGVELDKVPLYDVALFTHASRALGLDPLLRQCYWISRGGKGVLQVGIDGFCAIAERSGHYAGVEPVEYRGILMIPRYEWSGPKGNRVKKQVGEMAVPEQATARVWKIVAGHKACFSGVVHWDEYYTGETMWQKMPRRMLGKCATAQALRLAFPALLGQVALDVDDVMQAADSGELPLVNPPSSSIVVEEAPPTARKTYEEIYGGEADPQVNPTARTASGSPSASRPTSGTPAAPTSGVPNTSPASSATAPSDAASPDQPSDSPAPVPSDDLRMDNSRLLVMAADMGIAPLSVYRADSTWPDDKVERANAALEKRIADRQREGDAAVAQEQDRVL